VHAKDVREVTLEDLTSEAGEIHHGSLHTLFTMYTQYLQQRRGDGSDPS